MSSFPYTKLDAEKEDIRLLRLYPGSWDSGIKCDLEHISLQSNPDYEALSYTWGEPKDLRCISVGGHDCEVRPNLEIALRHLRFSEKERVLWIDALSINQEDISERNAQVPRMHEIYRKARAVLAWLGEAGEDGEVGLELMEEFGTLLFDNLGSGNFRIADFTFSWMKRNGFDISLKNWDALYNLWSRPYWSRIWVIQELASSIIASPLIFGVYSAEVAQRPDRCLIGCGRKWIGSRLYTSLGIFLTTPGAVSFSLFNFTFKNEDSVWKGAKREPSRGDPPALHMYSTLQRSAAEFCSKGCNSLGKLISLTEKFCASDPRDKVYGLLAMSLQRDKISPDYLDSNTVEILLKDLVKDLITSTQTLEIIHGNRRGHQSNNPTWVPELSGFAPRSAAWFRGETFNAGRLEGQTIFMDVRFDSPNDLLHIQGVEMGRLARVMGPFPASHEERRAQRPSTAENSGQCNTISSMFGYLSEVLEFGRQLDASEREDCWRTLLLNVNHVGLDFIEPAKEDLGKLFEIMAGLRSIPPELQTPEGAGDLTMILRPFYGQMEENIAERCFFTTEDGLMSLGPYHSQPGDIVAILMGGSFALCCVPKTITTN